MTNNKRYIVGLGEALWDVLPEGKNWAAPPPISPTTQASFSDRKTHWPLAPWAKIAWLKKPSKPCANMSCNT